MSEIVYATRVEAAAATVAAMDRAELLGYVVRNNLDNLEEPAATRSTTEVRELLVGPREMRIAWAMDSYDAAVKVNVTTEEIFLELAAAEDIEIGYEIEEHIAHEMGEAGTRAEYPFDLCVEAARRYLLEVRAWLPAPDPEELAAGAKVLAELELDETDPVLVSLVPPVRALVVSLVAIAEGLGDEDPFAYARDALVEAIRIVFAEAYLDLENGGE